MQSASFVLARQTHLVNGMLNEGLLSAKVASIFFSEISADAKNLSFTMHKMHRQQFQATGLKSQNSARNPLSITKRPDFKFDDSD